MNEPTTDELPEWLFETLGFCGCGNPESTATWLRDVLRTMTGDRATFESRWEERKRLVGDDERGLFVLYMIDNLELSEHGSSVWGSWLTPKGQQMLAKLESLAAEFNA